MSELLGGTANTETPTDLRSTIAAAFDEAEKTNTAAQEDARGVEKPAAEAPEVPASEEPAAPSEARVRGPDGKFIAKESAANEEGKAPAEQPPVATEDAPKAEEKQAVAEAPTHWSAADKQQFSALPPAAQAPFLDMYKRMESGFTPKLQRGAQLERDYGPVDQIFAPHAEGLRARGQTPAHVIHAWATVEQSLINGRTAAERGEANRSGAEIVANLIKAYRINPAEVADLLMNQPVAQAAPAAPIADPRVDRIEQTVQSMVRSAQAERETAAGHQITAFANEKDGQGNLKHPFFAEVEQEIGVIFQLDRQMGKTPTLDDAYDRAIHANREVRTKLFALNAEQEAKRAAADRKVKAAEAQRAAASVTGAPSPGQSPRPGQQNRSLRDTIAEAAADLGVA